MHSLRSSRTPPPSSTLTTRPGSQPCACASGRSSAKAERTLEEPRRAAREDGGARPSGTSTGPSRGLRSPDSQSLTDFSNRINFVGRPSATTRRCAWVRAPRPTIAPSRVSRKTAGEPADDGCPRDKAQERKLTRSSEQQSQLSNLVRLARRARLTDHPARRQAERGAALRSRRQGRGRGMLISFAPGSIWRLRIDGRSGQPQQFGRARLFGRRSSGHVPPESDDNQMSTPARRPTTPAV